MARKTSRREFIKTTATAATGSLFLPGLLSGSPRPISSNIAKPENVLRKDSPQHILESLYSDSRSLHNIALGAGVRVLTSRERHERIEEPDEGLYDRKNYGRRRYNDNDFFSTINFIPEEGIEFKIHVNDGTGTGKEISHRAARAGNSVNVSMPLTPDQGEDIEYDLTYRPNGGPWESFGTKSFKNPSIPLKDRNKVVIYFIADEHPWDWSENYSEDRLTGQKVINYLKKLFVDRDWFPDKRTDEYGHSGMYGLASALYTILMDKDGVDSVISLGDTIGLGMNYHKNFGSFGLDALTNENYMKICDFMTKRARYMFSDLLSRVPTKFDPGNHCGLEAYNWIRNGALTSKLKYLKNPGNNTYFPVELCGGDILMACLDVDGYLKVDLGEKLRTLEQHTLGKEQKQWLEETLRDSEAVHKFIGKHHVVGGLETHGAYGWGSLHTAEDYENMGIDPRRAEQVELSEMYGRYGVEAALYAHIHHSSFKEKTTKNGNSFAAISAGSPIPSVMAKTFRENEHLLNDYGNGYEKRKEAWPPPFLTGPSITKMTVEYGKPVKVQAICSGTPYHGSSNIVHFDKLRGTKTKIGDVLSTHYL